MLDKNLIQQLCAIALEAGDIILTFDRNLPEQMVQQDKVDGTLVTAADLAANAVVERGIQGLPIVTYPIISEEDPRSVNHIVSDFERCWLVDPLDGTRGYVRGWDDYTVNILWLKMVIIFGVIVHPVKRTCYWAASGLGLENPSRWLCSQL